MLDNSVDLKRSCGSDARTSARSCPPEQVHKRIVSANDAPKSGLIPDRSRDVPKTRNCLRCRTEFQSQWSGERICKHCKTSSTWKSGLPMASRSNGAKR